MTSKIRDVDLAFTREPGTGIVAEPTFSGALSFARRRYSKQVEDCDIAVVGVPFDLATTSRPGARLGPRAVRTASSMVTWDRVFGWNFDPFADLSVVDYGDVLFDAGYPDKIPGEIEEQFFEIHSKGAATLMLGGDHFSTYPVLRSLARAIGEPLSLIHFDAHSDTWADESGRIDHGTMFYHAAQQGIINPKTSAQIGIRTHNEDDHGFNIFSAEDVEARGAADIAQAVCEIVGQTPVYLTFDIDCLDPAFAPGTGTPVVGGLTSMQAQKILRGLAGIDLRSADVVEVAPVYDSSEITALAAATMAMNCIALFADGKKRKADAPPG